MIKLIIKKNKKSLNEKLLAISKKAHEEILSFVKDSIDNNVSKARTIINVPLKDIIYSNNVNFNLGVPFLYYGNIKNGNIPNEEIIQNWDVNNRKFNQEFIDNILKQNCELVVRIDSTTATKAYASMGAATGVNKQTVFIMSFFVSNIKNLDSVSNFIKHELRHLTQKLNNLCIRYAEKLKNSYDPKKVNLLKLNLKKTKQIKFGLGKQKTGIKKTNKANFKRGIASDLEYETYLADLVERYYNKVKNQIDSEDMPPHATAVKYTKLFLDKLRFEKEYKNYNLIADILLVKRPNEFPKDFLTSLEQQLY
jgi:hypothetical protein